MSNCRRRGERQGRDVGGHPGRLPVSLLGRSMNLPPPVIVAVPMAAAIAVFFWSLDRIRKERVAEPLVEAPPRATPRELVERLLRPAADNLSHRRSAGGKPTLTEDLARAGLNITPAEYLLIRIGAVALGALSLIHI